MEPIPTKTKIGLVILFLGFLLELANNSVETNFLKQQ
jgi:hypothetical protein